MQPVPTDPEDGEVEDISLKPNQTIGREGHTTIGIAGREVSINNRMAPYIGQSVAAVILLIAVTTIKGQVKNQGFGIAGAIIALIFSLAAIYLVRNPDMAENSLGTFPIFGTLSYQGAVAQFLFSWWFIVAAILTFSGPFLVTSNGYFASWAGVICAAGAIGVSPEALRSQAKNLGYLNALLVTSIVLLCSVPSYIGSGKQFHGETMFALVCALCTLIGILSFSAYPSLESMKFPFFTVFAIVWVVMACLVTFRGPFVDTGNGYFSAWFGAVLCCSVAAASFQPSLSQNI